jgi:NADH-quinone oxidoreductase subunit B
MASHYELDLDLNVLVFLRQADMLMVMGTISKKMAPILRQVYEQMSEPRWVIAVGACASSGVFSTPTLLYKELTKLYRLTFTYQVVLKTGQIVDGVMKLQELVRTENVRRRSSPEYQELLASYNKITSWH